MSRVTPEALEEARRKVAEYRRKVREDAHKEDMRHRRREQTYAGQDIGPIPPVRNPERRAACELDLRLFGLTYLSETFCLPLCDDHDLIIAKIQRAAIHGGLFPYAMPRGGGKTSWARAGALWAVLYGHRQFVALIAATDEASNRQLLHPLKQQLETNDLLLADFPEVCFPIRELQGQAARTRGQHIRGKPTRMAWEADRIVLPWIEGSPSAGAVVTTSGLTGALRGQQHTRPDGSVIRPSLILVDDPQTRGSAKSASQTQFRMEILNGDVLRMGGPDVAVAVVVPCTKIYVGDLADQLLDRKANPRWQGETRQALYSFPTNMKLWEEYREIRFIEFQAGGDGSECTAFYVEHQAEMDEGAEVAWPERHEPNEASGIQHCMNVFIDTPDAFWAEYQNQPQQIQDTEDMPTAEEIANKLSGAGRGRIPSGCTKLTTFVDVHKEVLYYAVGAFEPNFSGYLIDYGTFPHQGRRYFSMRDATMTLSRMFRGYGLEAAIRAGLDALASELLTKDWPVDGGGVMSIDRGLIDANWEPSRKTVYNFVRYGGHAAVVRAGHGRYYGASRDAIGTKRKPRERPGFNWVEKFGDEGARYIGFDTNFWKTFGMSRLAVPLEQVGCVSLYGSLAAEHQLFAEHLTAEFPVRVEGPQRVVDEWKMRPGKTDNHWLDCYVGCLVAASTVGISLPGSEARPRTQAKPRVKLSELQKTRQVVRANR
jgi:hypothetical protein